MIVTNNSAKFAGMPAFGGIVGYQDLIFGLRATNPSNAINLADQLNNAVILKNNASYTQKGIKGTKGRHITTNFTTNGVNDLTIFAVAKAYDVGSTSKIGWIAGSLTGAGGVGLMITNTTSSGSRFNYYARLYVNIATPGGRVQKLLNYQFASNTNLNTTDDLHIVAQIDTAKKEMRLNVNDQGWQTVQSLTDDWSIRDDTPWSILDAPRYNGSADVELSELLIWRRLLSDGEIAQQTALSKRYINSLIGS